MRLQPRRTAVHLADVAPGNASHHDACGDQQCRAERDAPRPGPVVPAGVKCRRQSEQPGGDQEQGAQPDQARAIGDARHEVGRRGSGREECAERRLEVDRQSEGAPELESDEGQGRQRDQQPVAHQDRDQHHGRAPGGKHGEGVEHEAGERVRLDRLTEVPAQRHGERPERLESDSHEQHGRPRHQHEGETAARSAARCWRAVASPAPRPSARARRAP